MCKASLLAAADFWRDEATTTVHQGARIEQEAKPTYWRIAFVGPFVGQSGTAQVIRFSANAEALEASIIFTAEITAGGGLLFVKKTREPGTSPETISIDPLNSSFVYSSQHANYMWNRANIWYGACTQYE
jgi:hypothetical protein